MHKETRNAIIAALILNIAIQIFFYLFIFTNKSDTTKQSTEHTANASATASNPDILQELRIIHGKLDSQNQLIAGLSNRSINQTDTQVSSSALPTAAAKLTEAEILETKQALINDLNKYGMTMPLFLADSRFQSLPSRTQSEILSELARRMDNNEIDKKQFMPGYKP